MSKLIRKLIKFCKICDAQLPITRAHILCEKCRIETGGYSHV
jgi:hypothetical protein